MIEREISRVLVLNLSGKVAVLIALHRITMRLTTFALIEGHPRYIRYTQPFMAGPPANSPVPRICTESGNRAFGSQHRRVVQVNERKKPGRGRETFPRLFLVSPLASEHLLKP